MWGVEPGETYFLNSLTVFIYILLSILKIISFKAEVIQTSAQFAKAEAKGVGMIFFLNNFNFTFLAQVVQGSYVNY